MNNIPICSYDDCFNLCIWNGETYDTTCDNHTIKIPTCLFPQCQNICIDYPTACTKSHYDLLQQLKPPLCKFPKCTSECFWDYNKFSIYCHFHAFLLQNKQNIINFNDSHPFSNSFATPLILEFNFGFFKFPTITHYLQAKKYEQHNNAHQHLIAILSDSNPLSAIKYTSKNPYNNYHQNQQDIITYAIRTKINQHYNIKKQLIETGDATIISYCTNDTNNTLGQILMQIRSTLSHY